jgi:hypothetical protein
LDRDDGFPAGRSQHAVEALLLMPLPLLLLPLAHVLWADALAARLLPAF